MLYGEEYMSWFKRMTQLGNDIQSTAMALLCGLYFALLVLPFLDHKKKNAACCGVFVFLEMLVFYFCEFDIPRGAGSVIRIVTGFLILYVIHRERPRQKLFLSLVFYCLTTLGIGITSEQYFYLTDFLYTVPVLNRTPNMTLVMYFVCIVEYVVVFGLLMGGSIRLIKRIMSEKNEEIGKKDFLFLSIPALIRVTQGFLYADYYDLYIKYFTLVSEKVGINDDNYFSYQSYIRLLDYVLFLVFLMMFLWLFYDSKRLGKQALQSVILIRQTEQMKSHVHRMEALYEEIRSIRHDMNHHAGVLQALLSKGETREAIEYLSSMGNIIKETNLPFSTGNPVTDIILSDKAEVAARQGIAFYFEFTWPDDFGFDVFDISGILGNALENAFSACLDVDEDKDPYVFLRSVIKGNFFFMEFRNSFNGALVTDPDTHLPRSTKKGVGHGYGLSNIQSIARKYRGDIDFEIDGEEAVLNILLQKS